MITLTPQRTLTPLAQAAEEAAAKYAALNFDAENERLAQIEHDIGRIETAVADARKESAQLAQLADEPLNIRGRTVAAAMMEGATAAEASATGAASAYTPEMRNALQGAIRDLHETKVTLEAEARGIKERVKASVREIAAPLVDVITSEAKSASERFAQCFADLKALRALTGAGETEASGLDEVTLAMRDCRLLLPGDTYSASDAVTDLFYSLSDKAPAFRLYFDKSSLNSTAGPEHPRIH